jgi:hypothetical protein
MKFSPPLSIALLMSLGACVPTPVTWHAITLHGHVEPGTDTGNPPADSGDDTGDGDPPDPQTETARWITFGLLDDGFGSAIARGDGSIWIGAPHGDEGSVYRWTNETLTMVLSGGGRLGSHLGWTDDGLWIAAPLLNNGDGGILLVDGSVGVEGVGGTGIAITSTGGGGYAWEDGWASRDGSEGTVIGRPSALLKNSADIMAIGMAHGPVSLVVGDRKVTRTETGDEAGFALASADLNLDGEPDWLIGAPGSNTVTALNGIDLTTLKVWTGEGRFGHSIAVCPLHPDSQEQGIPAGTVSLLVGAPMAGEHGRVHSFTNFTDASDTTWEGADIVTQLGSAITCGTGEFLAGAPGDAHRPGSVLWVQGLGLRSP